MKSGVGWLHIPTTTLGGMCDGDGSWKVGLVGCTSSSVVRCLGTYINQKWLNQMKKGLLLTYHSQLKMENPRALMKWFTMGVQEAAEHK